MEILLVIIIFVFALSYLVGKMTNFIKELKHNGSAKLSNGFEAKLSFVPIENKKSEVRATNTNSTTNEFE